MNRRNFLLTAAAGAGSLMFAGFAHRARLFAETGDLAKIKAVGYGELFPTAAKNTGETLLALPKGFEYTVIGKKGDKLADGNPTPRAHDGMATFDGRGELRIIRNHEVANKLPISGAAIGANPYDESAGGGTTTLVINPKTRLIERDFVSLSGTLVNCAGGRTPWGSWLSCEETTWGQTKFKDARGNEIGGFAKPHGYCFDVSASANNALPPVPLKAMGRFVHEAVAVDPKTNIVYLTEDNNPSGFYRFLPNRSKRLAEGGTLQILTVKDKPNFDTRKNLQNGATMTATWATIDNPDPSEADIDNLAVYKEGAKKGAAIFARLEGAFADLKGRIYFVSTSGGDAKGGQIWLYERTSRDEGRLTLVFESPDRAVLDMPDNICLHPKNDLIFMCEDGDYAGVMGTPESYLRILTADGKIADFAKNIVPGLLSSEFAGSTFTRDGKTLFVNLQAVGVTLAIWGEWSQFKM
jgi:hypothetical protein